MSTSVAIHDAQQLPELFYRVELGEEILIEREGHPPHEARPRARRVRAPETHLRANLLGITYIAPGLDAPMTEEELAEWGY